MWVLDNIAAAELAALESLLSANCETVASSLGSLAGVTEGHFLLRCRDDCMLITAVRRHMQEALEELEQAFEYGAAVKQLFIKEAAAELVRHTGDRPLSPEDACAHMMQLYNNRSVDPRQHFSIPV